MMKIRLNASLILSLVLVLLMGTAGMAVAQEVAAGDFQRITWMEEALFKTTYQGEPVNDRLSRLEDLVLGSANYSASPQQRVHKLHEALTSRKKATLQPAPQTSSTAKASTPLKTGKQPMALEKDPLPPLNPAPKELGSMTRPAAGSATRPQPQSEPLPNESDYPALAIMEQRVFGQHYEGEGLDSRLERIEGKVFGIPQKGPYYARVDNLRLVVLGDTATGGGDTLQYGNPAAVQNPNYFPGIPPGPNGMVNTGQTATTAVPGYPGQNYGTGYPQYPVGGQPQTGSYGQGAPSHPNVATDVANALTSVEDQILGETYPMESNSQRLDRLEQKIFSQTSPNVPEEDRLQRVIAVASAEGGDEPIGATTGGVKSTMKSLWPLIPFIILMLL